MIDSQKTAVLYNCVDTKLFKSIDKSDAIVNNIREKYGFSDDDFILIFVGRLSVEKGVDKVLDAMLKLPKRVKLLIVGSLFSGINVLTEYQVRIKEKSEKLHDRVYFTGYVKQEEMPYMYNVANVAVLPSMWEEPAGLTMVEAMACGVPVISTLSGGIPEYLGGVSILIQRDNNIVESIVASVEKLMNDEIYMQKLVSLGTKRAQLLSNDIYCEKFVYLIN